MFDSTLIRLLIPLKIDSLFTFKAGKFCRLCFHAAVFQEAIFVSQVLPRYFVARPDNSGNESAPLENAPLIHAIDSFYFGGRHIVDQELVVCSDHSGGLRLVGGEQVGELSQEIQEQLAYDEVAKAGKDRLIDALSCYLFIIQFMEQCTDSPGLNDPVYLYGRLFGPFSGAAGGPLASVEGQLTITRADILEGFVRDAEYAFHYAGSPASAYRCFHISLPGDREEELRAGNGIVIGYPLLSLEMVQSNSSNEVIVCQFIYDILKSLQKDMDKENLSGPLRSKILPVPNRYLLEQQLKDRGYEIKGNSAIRKGGAGQGFQGMLETVYGALMKDRLEIPPEGKIEDYLDLAKATLKSLKSWPSLRAQALRSRITPAPSEVVARAGSRKTRPKPIISSIPAPSSSRTPSSSLGSSGKALTDPPAWMNDFVSSHGDTTSKTSRITSTTSAFGKDPAMPKTAAAKKEPKAKKPKEMKPDWMKDFE